MTRLSTYKQKRNFGDTPEPGGGIQAKGKRTALEFVVQKHAASRLHYDFRLELNGVLKSWAVPKGPSLNPDDKRLAMQVEDHPYDYKDFEGTIPKGNYGAGKVIVWDKGTYEPLGSFGSKADQEKELTKELRKGSLKIRLEGSRLKGEFALVHIKGKDRSSDKDNAWLLIKHKDAFASKKDITKEVTSVVSHKTLESVGKPMPRSPKGGAALKSAPARKASRAPKKSAMPKNLSPMLATLVDKPFDDPGWIYEIKWDGYRALSFIDNGKVTIRSRNNKDFQDKYYPLRDELKTWKQRAVVDGEIVVTDEKGLSAFSRLQNWRSEADGPLHYYLFDLLWLDGYSLLELPLSERKKRLQEVIPEGEHVHYSDGIEAKGTQFFKVAEKKGLEGIIAKEASSLYTPGARSRQWLKIKTVNRQEVVIGGYTKNEDSPRKFSALLVGVFEGKDLKYMGKIGTGFDEALQKDLMARFKALKAAKAPFTEMPEVGKVSRFNPNPPKAKVTWLQPKLVCEVSFREITADGLMRHPSFEGMREDKNAIEVVLEKKAPAPAPKTRKSPKMDRKTLLNPSDETQTRKVDGHELTFTNLSKVYWPEEGYTKRDMLNYYYQVASYILPYLKGRPQSLNRFPDGISGQGFYQKDVSGKAPEWASLFAYHSGTDDKDRHFLVCRDEATLLYMAGLGCIEMNPWSSKVETPDHPDWCVLDLDPSKDDFNQVIETAQVIHRLLESVKVPSYCKTTGSTGLHVYIPLGAKYTYDQSKEFARIIARLVQEQLPATTTIERTVKQRKGKIYIDFLQNRPQATLACAYSLRPKPGATVSMPLHWEEVKKGLKTRDFTITNAISRIAETGDVFRPVLGKGIDLEKVLSRMQT